MEEHAADGNAAKPTDGGPRTPTPQKADHSAFLHPKDFVPRGAPGLTPAPRPPASGNTGKPAEKRPASGSPPAADEIVLTLGDVLSRIPTPYLKPGNHDAKRELRFKINDLSSDIARGRAAVPLSRIAHLVPDIFTRQIDREEDMEVRLPLQKLVEQIGLLRSQPKASVVEKIASPMTAAELPPAAKPVVEVEVKKEPVIAPVAGPVPAAQPSVLEPLTPAAGSPSPTPPIILSEPVVAPKTVELKPSAESVAAAAPVVLGPPPAAEPPSAPAASVAAIPSAVGPSIALAAPIAEPPVPAPASPVSESKPAIEPPNPVAAPELTQTVSVAPLVEPPVTPPQPQKIVIDWGALSSLKEEESAATAEPDLPEVVAETLSAGADAGEAKLAPSEPSDIDPSEEMIHLSLAAILRQCPSEILVGGMPQVDDSVRITLPFAPIDRQLVKGRVEMSALRFILALPESYQKHFVAKVGMKVPIPLEEVFQNLPAPKQELIPQPPVPPPVVLASATSAVAAAVVPAPQVGPVVQKPTLSPAAAMPISEPVTLVPAAVEVKITQPMPIPVEPTPSPDIAPAEMPKAETPVAPVPSEEAPSAAASVVAAPVEASMKLPIPAIRPIIGTPEASTAEKVAQPPLPTPVQIAVSAMEPAPDPSVAAAATTESGQAREVGPAPPKAFAEPEPAPATAPAAPPVETPVVPAPAAVELPPTNLSPAPQEAPPAAPVVEPVVSSAFVTSAEVNAVPNADAPKLKLQPPFFRPQFAPPPIFGFAPPSTTPEPEPTTRPEPPSVLAGLGEVAAVAPAAKVEPVAKVEPAALKEAPAPVVIPSAMVEQPMAAVVSPEPIEVKAVPAPAPVSEAEPSSEMIALAGEHDAPDIAHFSGEPVPFADLGDTLAHETTYAPDLAQVVHVDIPAPEPAKSKASPAAEAPAEQPEAASKPVEMAKPGEADEHLPVPIVEGLAAAAVAATITDHVPLDFRGMLTTEEEVKASEDAAAPVETPVVEAESKAEELNPVATVAAAQELKQDEPAVPAEAVALPAERAVPATGKLDEAAVAPVASVGMPVETAASPTPVVLAPESPAAGAAAATSAPPPHPLFPLPKVPAEPAHVEVLPPPSLPLRRFDQDAIQALFMTEETLDLPKISRLAAGLPGVYACVIATRDQACTGGNLPEGFDLAALLGLAPRVGEAAGRMPIGQLKHFTLYGDAYSVSFFERNGLSLCAVHRPRSFVPGVREKLVALADELSR